MLAWQRDIVETKEHLTYEVAQSTPTTKQRMY